MKENTMPQSNDIYKIVRGTESEVFGELVTEHLKQGYELHGSPALTFDGKDMVFAQAVVKTVKQLL